MAKGEGETSAKLGDPTGLWQLQQGQGCPQQGLTHGKLVCSDASV